MSDLRYTILDAERAAAHNLEYMVSDVARTATFTVPRVNREHTPFDDIDIPPIRWEGSPGGTGGSSGTAGTHITDALRYAAGTVGTVVSNGAQLEARIAKLEEANENLRADMDKLYSLLEGKV